MAAVVATTWQTQREVDLGVLQRHGTTASRTYMAPKQPALPAHKSLQAAAGPALGAFLLISASWYSTEDLGFGAHLASAGDMCLLPCKSSQRGAIALSSSTEWGAAWGEEGSVHARSCLVAELLPSSLSHPLSPLA